MESRVSVYGIAVGAWHHRRCVSCSLIPYRLTTGSIQCFALIPYTPHGVMWDTSSSPYENFWKYLFCWRELGGAYSFAQAKGCASCTATWRKRTLVFVPIKWTRHLTSKMPYYYFCLLEIVFRDTILSAKWDSIESRWCSILSFLLETGIKILI